MNVLVIGGAGFIGGHVAARYLEKGNAVTVFDNLSRNGTVENAAWLKKEYGNVEVVQAEIRSDQEQLDACVSKADLIFHLAAQVAVTSSVTDPREDFEINAIGTFNVLEAVRKCAGEVPIIYSSTNKVYGKMDDVTVVDRGVRYEYADQPKGISEARPLDFYSPYACSKGCGDQYMRDYARIYGLKTIVFRQSCIYGTRQFGIEDQGWVAWFTIASAFEKRITLYGDGKQIRDVLYVADLVDAYEKAVENIDVTAGQVYNIGGGPALTMSLLELIDLLENNLGRKIVHSFDGWRPGDQKVFVSDVRKAKRDFGWEPTTNIEKGVKKLFDWAMENKDLISRLGIV